MVETVRLIKKYPNRRLYDTQNSCYITLADVKQLVITRERFQVIDAKSGEDLTRAILLQIIFEEESGGSPMFTHEVLSEFIRFYGNAMQGFMGAYLQRNIQALVAFQEHMQAQAEGRANGAGEGEHAQVDFDAPAIQSLLASYMEHSRNLLEQMQRQILAQNSNLLANLQTLGVRDEAPCAVEAPLQPAAPTGERG
ncbi:MAG: polyhydroxyalkanoate synthesis repressor PhaR [Burkholderiales bacterium]|nr:polyhydroxyalkanoate synthesis repressor PhaR [Burkholderiales bacterium]PZN04564.1 MAG: polyhydroxyalkanoate synthesis repressor PhaR [Pseudomonadota bacterium]